MQTKKALAAAITAAVTFFLVGLQAHTAGAATLFSDDFQSYSTFPAGGWVDDSDSDSWAVATDGSKVARQTSSASETYLLTNGQADWQSYTVTARVKAGSTSVRNGIVARFTSSNNYYALLLHNGRLVLQKKVSGSTTILQQATFSYGTSAFYELSLAVSGTTVKGFVDGNLLVQGSDSALTAGKIALYAGGVASFDDVVVTDAAGPSPTPPAPTPTSSASLPVAGVTASGDDGNVPANTVDGSLSTRWSAQGDGVWIRYDLGSPVTVSWLEIAWHKGDQRVSTFDVQTSVDGSSWTTVINGGQSSGGTLQPEAYDFSDTTASYVRIVGHGNTQNDWTSITEVDLYGGGSSPSPTPSATISPTPSPSPSTSPPPPGGRIINVSNSSQLASAFSGAIAGDTIILANGNYSIGKLSGKHGTAGSPITVKAANRGLAVINSGQLEVLSSSYVVFEGLKWTNSDTLKVTSSHHVRLTRNHFRLTESSSLKWIIIQGADSHHNRIDHNLFEEKHQLGNFITLDGSETQQSQYDLIDHNHFRNIGPRAQNEMEAIRVGWSEISRSSGFTTIEYNLFENCDGDPEIVSVKSNDNTLRYNTFKTSQGTLSLRHGNRSQVYGNFFLGGGKAGTGGVRVYGQDHKIYNNYFEGLTGSGYDAALQLDGGDVDTSGALSAHWRVYRAVAVNNTFVGNVSNIEVGANYNLAPVDSVIANNVVMGSQGKLFNEHKTPVNMTYAGNIAWPTGSATVGLSKPDTAIRVTNPLLADEGDVFRIASGSPAIDASTGSHPYVTDDMDGQTRSGTSDAGADERSTAPVSRRPLTPADVGINAP